LACLALSAAMSSSFPRVDNSFEGNYSHSSIGHSQVQLDK